MQNVRIAVCAVGITLNIVVTPLAHAQSVAADVERLLSSGQAESAYATALRYADNEAGNADFDLAYARAALATQHPDQALFAIERVLAVAPEHPSALLELTRIEIVLGDIDGAQTSLNHLLTMNPPDPIRSQALALVPEIDRAIKRVSARVHAYAEAKYGYDTNINGASSLNTVDVIVAGAPTQYLNTPAQKDHFRQLDLGAETDQPIGHGLIGFTSLLGSVRENLNSDDFDSDTFDARAGAQMTFGRSRLRLAGQWQQYSLNDARYRRMQLLLPDWSLRLTPAHELFLFGQLGNIDYPQQPARDAELQLYGASWNHTPSRACQTMLSVYHGDERTEEDDQTVFRKHFGRRYGGWRIRWQSAPSDAQLIYFGIGAQHAKHNAEEPLFLVVREDDLKISEIGWHWQVAPKWAINLDVSYYSNRSNVSLYEYRRTLSQIGARYTLF